jgi:hypothetical protein
VGSSGSGLGFGKNLHRVGPTSLHQEPCRNGGNHNFVANFSLYLHIPYSTKTPTLTVFQPQPQPPQHTAQLLNKMAGHNARITQIMQMSIQEVGVTTCLHIMSKLIYLTSLACPFPRPRPHHKPIRRHCKFTIYI